MHAADRVRVRGPEDLAREQVRLQAPAGARRPDREHRDQVAVLDHARPDAGGQRQGHGRRVAAGSGDAAGPREPVALRARHARQLGDAVAPRAVVVAAVERRPVVGPLEPVVGAAVDDEGLGRELGGDGSGCPVRQCEEHDVVAGERLGRGLLQREVRVGAQVRLHRDERLAGVRVRRDGAHLEVGMVGEEAQDLPSGIAGRAGNGDGVRHGSTLGSERSGRSSGDARGRPSRPQQGSPGFGARHDVGCRARRHA